MNDNFDDEMTDLQDAIDALKVALKIIGGVVLALFVVLVAL